MLAYFSEDRARIREMFNHLAGSDYVKFPLSQVLQEPFVANLRRINIGAPDVERKILSSEFEKSTDATAEIKDLKLIKSLLKHFICHSNKPKGPRNPAIPRS